MSTPSVGRTVKTQRSYREKTGNAIGTESVQLDWIATAIPTCEFSNSPTQFHTENSSWHVAVPVCLTILGQLRMLGLNFVGKIVTQISECQNVKIKQSVENTKIPAD